MTQKKLGNFQLIFPSTWNYCAFEGQNVTTGLVIPANTDKSVSVTFVNKYYYLPMVIPVIYTTGGKWAYYTAMISNLTKTGCTINVHNLENSQITVMVGYIIIG